MPDDTELWSIAEAAEYLGIKPSSARGQLSRWGVRGTHRVGTDGRARAYYPAAAVRAAHAARPGPGARTDRTT
ncbi:hypothetical protein LHJ74_14800 [Streptomyces sp. N2-109]|uniref:HTH merR-type domain-containing protein n=1 Tax=Streptomyces gossypii TaxID=2883101 RepID=A0ABT2JTT1_9ACTN|nr:hypothetical protein [Streptomyces gossypii]MCT2591161.1 hypothetical protein [Streptomyces gossypii]